MELTRRNLGKLAVATGAAAAVGTGVGTTLSRSADAAATWKTTGTAVSALAGFDTQMKTFMQARGVTGGQLAVTYKGRLVLARGYSTSTTLDTPNVSESRTTSCRPGPHICPVRVRNSTAACHSPSVTS